MREEAILGVRIYIYSRKTTHKEGNEIKEEGGIQNTARVGHGIGGTSLPDGELFKHPNTPTLVVLLWGISGKEISCV